ncbi:MAG: protease adaptor protein RcdA [Caulobacteraceae bacterium]
MTEASGSAANRWRTNGVQDFASSELFDRTFQEGMELVEETAAYLDGAGRQDSKLLSRSAALAYAGESMRLTTRLMQVASWLLVQRAVREGDMNPTEACQDRYRLAEPTEDGCTAPADELPSGLLQLLERSARLYERVLHLDRRMYRQEPTGEADHPVLSQIEKLNAAFGKK